MSDPQTPPSKPTWRSRWRSHLFTVALLLAVFFGVQAWQTRAVPAQLDLQQPVQWLLPTGQTQNGSLQQALDVLRLHHPGQPVALYVWAEWCPICRTMEGSVTRLGQDWPLLTVAMQSGPAAQVQRYQQQRGLPWHSVIDARGELAQALGQRSVPAFMVIDAQGRVHHPTVGFTTGTGMRLRLWAVRVF
ncbi:thiol-disulfide isomerase and thioredoxin [Serpentinimonas raichei]|uniref:Thiol-disulfide isomerase and thioredoxin n=1 Tax=Serpentinimonas raichei TaxID=1458425 RepID=A0A060NNB4_9BURK|nr:redoxin domain-containing protein [Serpentinimonas raichei]BAO80389.1 thiol-disulfide isomerase and thioredoxin [Serpentinimonas raichei]